MVTRTRPNVTLYIHCRSNSWWKLSPGVTTQRLWPILGNQTTKSLSVQPAEKTRFETGIPWITSRVPALAVWVYSCGEPSVGKTCKHNILEMSMNFKCAPTRRVWLSLQPTQRKQMYLVAGRSVSQTNDRITCLGTTWRQSAHKSPYFFTRFKKKGGGGFKTASRRAD
jgi:hypothetical protein